MSRETNREKKRQERTARPAASDGGRSQRRRRERVRTVIVTAIAAGFAILFLLPTVLTMANSFMSASEISANYGKVFATNDTGGKAYIAEKVNLKLIWCRSASISRCF